MEPIRCRIAACREALNDGNQWSFYLINDSDAPLDSAELYEVSYEWGDEGSSEPGRVRISDLAPGAHALIWRDDGSGAELRMELSLRVQVGAREARINFEFPKLYRLTGLPMVAGLGKRGYEVTAEGRPSE
jgi:hypothetical protein